MGRKNVAAYELPLWLAMNFASVDEVEAALMDVIIVHLKSVAELKL